MSFSKIGAVSKVGALLFGFLFTLGACAWYWLECNFDLNVYQTRLTLVDKATDKAMIVDVFIDNERIIIHEIDQPVPLIIESRDGKLICARIRRDRIAKEDFAFPVPPSYEKVFRRFFRS